jgi:hypothetical protein
MHFNKRDLVSGGIVAATGLFFALTALRTLPIGTTLRMGPGYFPFAVGLLVAALGIAITVGALRPEGEAPLTPLSLRPLVLIPGAILASLATVRGAGLVPAVFLVVVISRAADRESRLAGTLVIALTLCALTAAIFVYGLGLPIPMFGPWWPGN